MVYKWLDLIHKYLPGHCLLCGDNCPAGISLDLCIPCQQSLPLNHRSCRQCGQPLAQGEHCGHCQGHPPPFAHTHAPWLYAPPLDSLILRLKTPMAGAPARTLGQLMVRQLLPTVAQALPDMLVPVPLHPHRLRERGFNQAALLARHLAGCLDLPWRTDLLSKTRESADQRGLDRRARRRNLRHCFSCRPLPAGCHVALVDDVVTTGATAWEATLALKRAGAGQVDVWALARTP